MIDTLDKIVNEKFVMRFLVFFKKHAKWQLQMACLKKGTHAHTFQVTLEMGSAHTSQLGSCKCKFFYDIYFLFMIMPKPNKYLIFSVIYFLLQIV